MIDDVVWHKVLTPPHSVTCPACQIQEADKCNVYDTVVFEGPPKTEQTLWPRHCVQESWGAELHKDLKVRPSLLPLTSLTTQLRSTLTARSSVKESSQILTPIQHFLITLSSPKLVLRR